MNSNYGKYIFFLHWIPMHTHIFSLIFTTKEKEKINKKISLTVTHYLTPLTFPNSHSLSRDRRKRKRG